MTRSLDIWDGPGPDYCSRKGAEALAAKLDAYWHDQGYPQVAHWIEQVISKRGGRLKCWCVRSNLIHGLPPPPDHDDRLVPAAAPEIGCDVR